MNIKKLNIIYLLIIMVAYYILSYLTPFCLNDDLVYKFIWPYDNDSFTTPIKTIKDVIESQYIHYHVLNGRSIIHFFIQLFDGILGKGLCNIISAIMLGCFIFLMANFTNNKNKLLTYTLITSMVFLIIPGFHNEFLMFVGVINYLWVGTVTLLFVTLLKKYKNQTISKKILAFSPLSFLAGWLHEGITVPISLSLVIYCIYNYKNIVKSPILYCTLWYILGTAFCIFSPGTMQRIGNPEYTGFIQFITQKLFIGTICLMQLRISILMIILAIFTFCYKKNIRKDHLCKYKYLYLTWIFSFIPVFGSNTTETRTIFFTECIALIIAVDLLLPYLNKYSKGTIICCNIATLLVYSFVLKYTIKNYQNYKYILQQLENPATTIISVPQISELNNKFLNSYIREPIKFGPFENAQAFVDNNTHVKCIKTLYGKKELHFIPKDIMNKIKSNSLKYNRYTYNNNKEMLAIKIATNCSPTSIKFLLYKEDINSLPFYKRLLAYHGNIYEQSNYYYDTINYGKSKYLLICCPTRNISRRIKYVVYKH